MVSERQYNTIDVNCILDGKTPNLSRLNRQKPLCPLFLEKSEAA